MLPVSAIFRLISQNRNPHVLCRSIARGVDGQWKYFVNSQWLLTLPEFDKGFPEAIKFAHRRDTNALYFGPHEKAFSQTWADEAWIQSSISSLLGADKYCFTAKNFHIPAPVVLDGDGLTVDQRWRWTFDRKGFMPLIQKHEPFSAEQLQAFFVPADSGSFGARAARIASPQRDFYVILEELK